MIIRSRLLVYLFAVIIALDSTNASPPGMNEFMSKVSRYWSKPKSASTYSDSRTTSADQTLSRAGVVSKYEQSHFSKTPKLKYEMELNAKDGSLTKREFGFQNDKRVIKKETVLKQGEKGYNDAFSSFLEQSRTAKGHGASKYKPSLLNKLEKYSFKALDGSFYGTDFQQKITSSKLKTTSRFLPKSQNPKALSTHSVTVEKALDRYKKTLKQVSPGAHTSLSDIQKFEEANNPLSEVLTKTSKPLLSKHELETRMELFQKDGSLSIMKIGPGKDERTLKSQSLFKKGDEGYEEALKEFNDQSSLALKGDSNYKPSLLNQHETFTFEALDGEKKGRKFSRTNPNEKMIYIDRKIDENSPRGRQLKRLIYEREQNHKNRQKSSKSKSQNQQKANN